MTEYDYSPEAHERYIAKQNAIARWVDDTNHHIPSNPFLPSASPSVYPGRARGFSSGRNYKPDTDIDYERSSSSWYQQRRDRDDGYRRGRSRDDRQGSHYRHNSRKNSRSSSSPPSSYAYIPQQTNGYFGHQQYPYNSATTQQYPYGSSSNTPASSPSPRTPYESQSYQPVVVPIDGGTRGYVVVPPKGVSYQLMYPQQSQPPSQAQPWYKRVFSPAPSASSGKNRMSKSNSSSSRGRSRKWSWDIY